MCDELRAVRQAIRETRADMKAQGIRRLSVFNGGHTAESYRLNARMFELETRLKRLQAQGGG